MNKKERFELAGWAVKQAQKQGADEVAVDLYTSRDIEISFRDRVLEQLKESTQNSLSIDVYAGGRYSGHSTNDMRRESLATFIENAVAMTKYLSEDPHRALPDPKYYRGQKQIDLEVMDASHGSLTSEERVRTAKEIEESALSHSDQVVSCTAGFDDSSYVSTKVHSNGFEGERAATTFSAGASATVKDAEGGRPSSWDWKTVRHLKDIGGTLLLGPSAVDRALAKVGQTKMASGIYDMVVDNRAASGLLGAFYSPMTGRALQRKSSFLDGKLGEKIASDKMTWIDDPFIPRGLGSRLFDGEGMATQRRVMIDKGVLRQYFIDNYYGRKLGVEPTIGSRTNVVFEYGSRSRDEMVKDVKKGILVTQFIGGNSNATTGDYSYGVIGQYIENGKVIKPINEMNISGNLTELFQQLTEMGNDPYEYSTWRRPSLHFKDIQFSGL